jgi:hypothetical protein
MVFLFRRRAGGVVLQADFYDIGGAAVAPFKRPPAAAPPGPKLAESRKNRRRNPSRFENPFATTRIRPAAEALFRKTPAAA